MGVAGDDQSGSIDLAPRKIRVNSVHPGPIDTEMLCIRTPEQNRQLLQLVPMKRMGTAEEVASLVLFLLSDESGYTTAAEVAIGNRQRRITVNGSAGARVRVRKPARKNFRHPDRIE
jgi:NAD(P)-dependent dehydrogenase (short-subunit alcohol dehydrogenase family)